MIGNFIIQLGSTLPWLSVQITKDGFVDVNLEAQPTKGCAKGCDDNVLDLTDCQVSFELFKCGRTPARVATQGQTVIVGDPKQGCVQYQWAAGDLTSRCLYYGTFVVVMPDNTILRWPYALEQLTIEVR